MATVPRAIGTTIYERPLVVEADMEILDRALVDWYAYAWLLTDELTMLKNKWFKNNLYVDGISKTKEQATTEFRAEGTLSNNFYHSVNGMFLISNNTCVGVSKGYVENLHYVNELVAIDPAHRGQGYLSESTIMGQKTLFQIYGFKSTSSKFPINLPSETPENATLVASLEAGNHQMSKGDYTEVEQVNDAGRSVPLQYSISKMTKEEWEVWINLPENAAKKNASYTWEWEFTV